MRYSFLIRISPAILISLIGLLGRAGADSGQTDGTIDEKGGTYRCRIGDRPLFEYRTANVPYKPYVEKLWTPSGTNILRDSPSDHRHHHALMLGINVDSIDFWAEDSQAGVPPGRQITRTIQIEHSASPVGIGIETQLDWTTSREEILLAENRTLWLHPTPLPVTLLSWQSIFTPGGDRKEVELTGRHYEGLGIRFLESMDRGGRFFTSTGQLGPVIRGDERNTPCTWCAYTAPVNGKRVTVAIFDHPENDRPMVAFTMGDTGTAFAYLAATWNLWQQPMRLTAGQPARFLWGIAAWDGEVDRKTIESLRAAWLEWTTGGLPESGLAGQERQSLASPTIP